MIKILLLLTVFLVSYVIFATPSLNGCLGIGVLADTSITEEGRLDVAVDYYLNDGDYRKNTFPIRINLEIDEDAEIGIGYTYQKSESSDHNAFNVNGKYRRVLDEKGVVLGSVGAKYSNISNYGTAYNVVLAFDVDADRYFYLSKDSSTVLTLGANWMRFNPKGVS